MALCSRLSCDHVSFLGGFGQALVEVVPQVVEVLQADRKTQQPVGDPAAVPVLRCPRSDGSARLDAG